MTLLNLDGIDCMQNDFVLIYRNLMTIYYDLTESAMIVIDSIGIQKVSFKRLLGFSVHF